MLGNMAFNGLKVDHADGSDFVGALASMKVPSAVSLSLFLWLSVSVSVTNLSVFISLSLYFSLKCSLCNVSLCLSVRMSPRVDFCTWP
mmetsp:Transcript_79956/g.213945  ORF Transcript_79956/g.213945 Transcript_79956/m.213945 type:complete len:88 (-) Transcript_79956:15-278(-)